MNSRIHETRVNSRTVNSRIHDGRIHGGNSSDGLLHTAMQYHFIFQSTQEQ